MATPSKYAYVWLLMKGDSYFPGVFNSVMSVKRTGSKHDLVVMVTHDVSPPVRRVLAKIASVEEVDYLHFRSREIRHQRLRELYQSWISVSYTKMNILKFHRYDKILFLDADTLILNNIDHLFSLRAPAACFNSPWLRPVGKLCGYLTGNSYLKHGVTVPMDKIATALRNNYTMACCSGILLVEPRENDFKDYKKLMGGFASFGDDIKGIGYDEQSILLFYTSVKRRDFTNIHHQYNLTKFWEEKYLTDSIPYVLHYFGDAGKPWDVSFKKVMEEDWLDVISWYHMLSENVQILSQEERELLKVKDYARFVQAKDTFIQRYFNGKITEIISLKEMDMAVGGRRGY